MKRNNAGYLKLTGLTSRGYFLLEVLIAISILAIGAASFIRVFGQSFRVQQKIEETEAGKNASEALLFKLVSGEFSELLSKKGRWKKGAAPMPDLPEGKLDYEILSERIENSKSSAGALKPGPAAGGNFPQMSLPAFPFDKNRSAPFAKNLNAGSASAAGQGKSADLYQVEIKIFKPAGKEIYNTRAIVRNETASASSKSDVSQPSAWDRPPIFPFPSALNGDGESAAEWFGSSRRSSLSGRQNFSGENR